MKMQLNYSEKHGGELKIHRNLIRLATTLVTLVIVSLLIAKPAATSPILINGDFETGNTAGWFFDSDPNGTLGPPFYFTPRVWASYPYGGSLGGGFTDNFLEVKAGWVSWPGGQLGGTVWQPVQVLGAKKLTLTADIGVADTGYCCGLNYPGLFEVIVDSTVVGSYNFPNFYGHGPQSATAELSGSINLTAGIHDVGIRISRPAASSYPQFLDNVVVTLSDPDPGGTPLNPLIPLNPPSDPFFELNVQWELNGLGDYFNGAPVYIDPPLAQGFIYEIVDENVYFGSVVIPTGIDPDGEYDLYAWNGLDYEFLGPILEGEEYSFFQHNFYDLTKFKLLSISELAGVDSEDPLGFPTGLTFYNPYQYAEFIVHMTPIPYQNGNAPVPEPGTMFLLGTGLVGVVGAARRRKKNQV